MATAESVKAKIRGLIETANTATGSTDADLTTAVSTLVDGYGKGSGDEENVWDYACTIRSIFTNAVFNNQDELYISFGNKTIIYQNAFEFAFQNTDGYKTLKLSCKSNYSGTISLTSAFTTNLDRSMPICIDLTEMQELLKVDNFAKAFYNRRGLIEIKGEFDMTSAYNAHNSFAGCKALETVRFKESTIGTNISFEYCSNLTDDTIQNIVDGLADMTDSTALTLTLHADVGAKLTETQKSTISSKNWTVAY